MLKFMTFLMMAMITLSGCEQSSFEGSAPIIETPTTPEPPVPVPPTEPGLLTEIFTANPEPEVKTKVDVLFLMDTSGSMIEEKDAVETQLQEFISKFDESLDYHVYVVGSEIGYPGLFGTFYTPFDIELGELANSDRVTKINEPVDSFNALQVFLKLISEEDSPLNLRDDASLEVVVVSDDNPISLEEAQFSLDQTFFTEYKDLFTDGVIQYPLQSTDLISVLEEDYLDKTIHFNGFIGEETSTETATCQVQNVGTDYIELATHEKFKGFVADICSTEWASKFDDLATAIIEQNIAQKFGLKQAPNEEQTLKLYINDELIDEEKYTIVGTEIIFDQSFEPTQGDTIKITYFAI